MRLQLPLLLSGLAIFSFLQVLLNHVVDRSTSLLTFSHEFGPLFEGNVIIIALDFAFASATTVNFRHRLLGDRSVFLNVDVRQLLITHQTRITTAGTIFIGLLTLPVHLLEENKLLFRASHDLIQVIILHLLLITELLCIFRGLQQVAKEFISLFVGGLVVELSGLDNFAVHVKLELGTLQNLLFDGVGTDQSQNANLVLLTDTMGTILSLKILVRIPVGIENDHSVCSG